MPANQLSLKLGGDDDVELLSVRGREEMSRPFEFELEVSASRDLEDLRKLAITAEISFEGVNGEPRFFHGIVSRCSRALDEVPKDAFRYQISVVPWFALLRFHQDCRIFQEKSVIDVFKAVVGDHGFADFDVSNVRNVPVPLDYCVQYRESDFDFLSRLLEEHGIFYFFRHSEGKHVMVLGDGQAAYETAGEELVYARATSTTTAVSDWSESYRFFTGKTTLREYDPEAPTTPIESESSSVLDLNDADKFAVRDYTGRFTTKSRGDEIASLRMQFDESTYDVARGSGNAMQIAVGRKFKLGDSFAGPKDALPERHYVCTAIDHNVSSGASGYSCSFSGIPDSRVFRPARVTPRALVHGPQTATVVGPSGEEIFTDELGRIKVQFHWDRLGKRDETSSCFVRVAQPLAGNGYGFWFLPRIGHEVVVQFLEGDPDRPLVTGSVYNSALDRPFPLTANMTQSGIRTHSTKEGAVDNCNEIRFEDKKDSEELFIQAEKDMKRVVKNDDAIEIGNAQAITIDKADRTVELKQGNDTLKVSKGNRNVEISMGNDALNIKMGDHTTKVDVGASSTEAMTGIELKVGQNSIKIDQSGITVKGLMVSIQGQTSAEVKGLMLTLSGDAMASLKGGITNIG